jgi:hypothetical protein
MRALVLNEVYCPDFDQIRIFANPNENLKNAGPPIEWGFGPD